MSTFGTGSPREDAQSDFQRTRRREALERIAHRLRREPTDVDLVLPYEEVIEALGYTGERYAGLQSIELDTVVGSVGRRAEFSRSFRPRTTKTRERWERIARAQRQGESFPPIDVYRIGEAHFVKDGHHRVSVAKALGHTHIDAYVTEVHTKVGADRRIRLTDLPVKEHERLFRERVPLPAALAAAIDVTDPWNYAVLAEAVEAFGFRLMQECDELMSREEVARRWFAEEYAPVLEVLRDSDMIEKDETDAEAYMRVAAERYRLLRTHSWAPEVWERVSKELS